MWDLDSIAAHWLNCIGFCRRFTGPRPEGFGGFGDKKEGGSKANNDDDDFWGYAEEGADANL